MELAGHGDVRELKMLEAGFPNDQMLDTTYTFLMTEDYRSWIAVDMTCVRVKRFMERFRRGHRLLCEIDKRDWIDAE